MSVRAALVSSKGELICSHSEPIDVYNPQTDFYEQSSDNIWNQTCIAINAVVNKSNIENVADKIGGIGFDATCSLVVLDADNKPLSISPTNDPSHNIILWMDHRAIKQAETINAMSFNDHIDDEKEEENPSENVLQFVGGKISPEMEIPKILWLKQNMPSIYEKAAKFMDLADFLTFKSTECDIRSICTLTCKWTFRGDLVERNEYGIYDSANGWNEEFLCNIGLEDIVSSKYEKFGMTVGDLGQSIGTGLCKKAADEMGLKLGTAVSIGMIDAHCGAIGLLGSNDIDLLKEQDIALSQRMALICGTSTCHMLPIEDKVFVEGIWGPFYSSLMPSMWLLEAGQSATGSLIDYMIRCSNCYESTRSKAQERGITIYQFLNSTLKEMASSRGIGDVSYLTRSVHVNPYFHGNRSPLADPTLKGMCVGMKLNEWDDMKQCAVWYLATLQALCYDSKLIIDTMMENGADIQCVFATGGLSKNPLFMQLHADITQIPIVLPVCEDSVLIGAAVLGMVAHRNGEMSFEEAMGQMNHAKSSVMPTTDAKLKKFHECKYRVFQRMIDDYKAYESIMDECDQIDGANSAVDVLDELTDLLDK